MEGTRGERESGRLKGGFIQSRGSLFHGPYDVSPNLQKMTVVDWIVDWMERP